MAAGTTIQHKRKAGAFAGGQLAAGEIGVDTTNGALYFSTDGATVATLTPHAAVTLGASLTDVLSLSSQVLSAVDAGSDKLKMWDDSASKETYATIGAGLTMTGTTLSSCIGSAEAALYTGGVQTLTDSYADVSGSSITIIPTSTASKILYSCSVQVSSTGTGQAIASFRFYRDGSEITTAKSQVSIPGIGEIKTTFQFVTANTSTSSTTFKIQARRLSASFPCKLHETYYFDGGPSSTSSSASVSAFEIID